MGEDEKGRDMTNIVERLRKIAADVMPGNLCDQAADEIERLSEALREAEANVARYELLREMKLYEMMQQVFLS